MTTIADQIPKPSPYGAQELKVFIRKYTWQSFAIALGIFIILLVSYITVSTIQQQAELLKPPPVVKLKLQQLPPPPADAPPVPPPPAEVVIAQAGPAARAGTPVPVPDALIPPDLQDFAKVDEIARATAEGGDEDFDGMGFGDDIGSDIQIDIAPQQEEVDPYEFVPVEKEPYVDQGELRKAIEYPEVAYRAGIEGKVFIRVYVGKDGKPIKYIVEHSDNEVFDKAAAKAVMAQVFTPGIQNGQPIACWVSIPITFKLK